MEHWRLQEQVSLLIDGLINDDDSIIVFAHLAECRECRNMMKVMKRVRSHWSEERLLRVPRSVEQRIATSISENRVASERKPLHTTLWFSNVSIPLPAAASILLLIIFSSLLLSPFVAGGQSQTRELPPELNHGVSRFLQQPF